MTWTFSEDIGLAEADRSHEHHNLEDSYCVKIGSTSAVSFVSTNLCAESVVNEVPQAVVISRCVVTSRFRSARRS